MSLYNCRECRDKCCQLLVGYRYLLPMASGMLTSVVGHYMAQRRDHTRPCECFSVVLNGGGGSCNARSNSTRRDSSCPAITKVECRCSSRSPFCTTLTIVTGSGRRVKSSGCFLTGCRWLWLSTCCLGLGAFEPKQA
jgi:hypothetical protein